MAKDFESLKQQALVIKNEVEDGANSSERVGGMLEDIVESMKLGTTEFNVSAFFPTGGTNGSNKYDLSTAIGQVPAELRIAGLTVSFINSDGDTEKWEFSGGSWAVGSFEKVGAGKLTDLIKNEIININHLNNSYDTYSLEEAISLIPDDKKHIGTKIRFRFSTKSWMEATYMISAVEESYWNDVANWIYYELNDITETKKRIDTLEKQVENNISALLEPQYKQGSYDVINGTFYPSITNAVSTSIVINGGLCELYIVKPEHHFRGAFLSDVNGKFIKNIFTSTNKKEFSFTAEKSCYLNIVIRKDDESELSLSDITSPIFEISKSIVPLKSMADRLFGCEEIIKTDYTNQAVDTGTGKLVSMNTRLSTGFVRGPLQIQCPDNVYIRSVVKYSNLDNYDNYEVIIGNVSLSSYNIDDDKFYIITFWNGDNTEINISISESITIKRVIEAIESKNVEWASLGDSIVEGYYSVTDGTTVTDRSKGWVNTVAIQNGYILTNYGIGGTGYLSKGPDNNKMNAKELVQAIDFTKYQLVTLSYGVNDWKYNQLLGSVDDSTETESICGNMKFVIEYIMSTNPNCKLIVTTPLNCCMFGNKETNWGIGHSFSNNGTLQDIYNAFVKICDYYGIQYIDMTHYSAINRLNITTSLYDGVHPSELMHKVLGRELSKKITF